MIRITNLPDRDINAEIDALSTEQLTLDDLLRLQNLNKLAEQAAREYNAGAV